jgi:hypothetical protein
MFFPLVLEVVLEGSNNIMVRSFPNVPVITRLMSSFSMDFRPGFFDILQTSTTSPSQLKSLLSDFRKQLGIRLLVVMRIKPALLKSTLELDNCCSLSQLPPHHLPALPAGVTEAIQEGCAIICKGILLFFLSF